MSKQDRQGVRTPADVERKYDLGAKFKDIMHLLDAHRSAQEELDSATKELHGDLDDMKSSFQESIDELWRTKSEMEETVEDMKENIQVSKKDFENTRDELRESIGGIEEDIAGMEADLTPLAEWSDGERSGIAGFVARADEDSSTIGALVKQQGDTNVALAGFKAEVSEKYATVESVASLESETSKAIAGVKQEATERYATIESIATFKTETNEALTGIRQEASEMFATIESVASLKTETNEAIAGVKQEASDTYATIESLASLETEMGEAIAGVRQEAADKYATIESLASFETETTEALAGVKQYADDTFATIESVALLRTDTNTAIAGVKQEASEKYAEIESLAALETETSNAIAGFKQEVADTYAKSEDLVALETANSEAIAGVRQEASDTYATQESLTAFETETAEAIAGIKEIAEANQAQVAIFASWESDVAKIASIEAKANANESALLLKADKVELEGLVSFTGLADGTTTIDGACIKTGKISSALLDTSYINATLGKVGGFDICDVEGLQWRGNANIAIGGWASAEGFSTWYENASGSYIRGISISPNEILMIRDQRDISELLDFTIVDADNKIYKLYLDSSTNTVKFKQEGTLPDLPDIPDVPDVPETTYTLTGKWLFNVSLDISSDMYESGFNQEFSGVVYGGDDGFGLCLISMDAGTLLYENIGGDVIEVYDNGGWADNQYRCLDFGTGKAVSKDFYNWFIANAISVTSFPVEGTFDLTGKATVDGETLVMTSSDAEVLGEILTLI